MKVLKNILNESEQFYLKSKAKIEKELFRLPKGNVKKRKISGHYYYYLQQRVGKRIVHKYLGKDKPGELMKQIDKREKFKDELKKVREALRVLSRTKGRKYDKSR